MTTQEERKTNRGYDHVPYEDAGDKTFAEWAEDFKIFVDYKGHDWDESRKIAALIFHIDPIKGKLAKEVFGKLKGVDILTLEAALAKMTEVIDTTRVKDMAKWKLHECRQEEGESVSDFASRFLPLV